MLNKIKEYLKNRNYIKFYYKDLKVMTIDKKHIIKKNNNSFRIDFACLRYYDDYIEPIIENLPYLDASEPAIIEFDRNKQITEVVYIAEGLGKLYRERKEKPALIKLENGIIKKEEYCRTPFEYKDGYSECNVPLKIIYKEDQVIDDEKSVWLIEDQKINHRDYKNILEEIQIDIDNFKILSYVDRRIINIYMQPNLYIKELREINIDPNKESIKENIDILRMYLI